LLPSHALIKFSLHNFFEKLVTQDAPAYQISNPTFKLIKMCYKTQERFTKAKSST
jgi:hypothetical protein